VALSIDAGVHLDGAVGGEHGAPAGVELRPRARAVLQLPHLHACAVGDRGQIDRSTEQGARNARRKKRKVTFGFGRECRSRRTHDEHAEAPCARAAAACVAGRPRPGPAAGGRLASRSARAAASAALSTIPGLSPGTTTARGAGGTCGQLHRHVVLLATMAACSVWDPIRFWPVDSSSR
jgi:hypothetical protein